MTSPILHPVPVLIHHTLLRRAKFRIAEAPLPFFNRQSIMLHCSTHRIKPKAAEAERTSNGLGGHSAPSCKSVRPPWQTDALNGGG